MVDRYCDTNHVAQSLGCVLSESDADKGTLYVLDTDARMVALSEQEMEERNLWAVVGRYEDQICTIDWEKNSFGGAHKTLKFHENVVENEFSLLPAGPRAIDAKQASCPTELSESLRKALQPLLDGGAIFTFAGVEAASMAGGGHYCDFEFEYSID